MKVEKVKNPHAVDDYCQLRGYDLRFKKTAPKDPDDYRRDIEIRGMSWGEIVAFVDDMREVLEVSETAFNPKQDPLPFDGLEVQQPPADPEVDDLLSAPADAPQLEAGDVILMPATEEAAAS